MTDNEIIQAVERCINKDLVVFYHIEVPDRKTPISIRDIARVIANQKTEIKKCENIIRLADKTIKTQSAEIERLQEKLNHSIGVDNTKENGYFPFD